MSIPVDVKRVRKEVKVFMGPTAQAEAKAWVGVLHIRAPHHTASAISMIGVSNSHNGQIRVSTGECGLANGGALLLTDFAEWKPDVCRAIGKAWREGTAETFAKPCGTRVQVATHFEIVATSDECPCGVSERSLCKCTPQMVKRWTDRIAHNLNLLKGVE